MAYSPIVQAILEANGLAGAIRIWPVVNPGQFVLYEGSVEEKTGQKAYIADRVEQPAGKTYRHRYVLRFKDGETISHVRPTSFTVIDDVSEKTKKWSEDYFERWLEFDASRSE